MTLIRYWEAHFDSALVAVASSTCLEESAWNSQTSSQKKAVALHYSASDWTMLDSVDCREGLEQCTDAAYRLIAVDSKDWEEHGMVAADLRLGIAAVAAEYATCHAAEAWSWLVVAACEFAERALLLH